jgi:hypothetical protein
MSFVIALSIVYNVAFIASIGLVVIAAAQS